MLFYEFLHSMDPERVYVEAETAHLANERAEMAPELHIYFDGVRDGLDCPCCGDAWYRAYESDGDDFDGLEITPDLLDLGPEDNTLAFGRDGIVFEVYGSQIKGAQQLAHKLYLKTSHIIWVREASR